MPSIEEMQKDIGALSLEEIELRIFQATSLLVLIKKVSPVQVASITLQVHLDPRNAAALLSDWICWVFGRDCDDPETWKEILATIRSAPKPDDVPSEAPSEEAPPGGTRRGGMLNG
ncbi:MAG TPA: hypothetical protein VJL27_02720 [Patescibacteria group bacterium]|nr:hypothetical protein [Patescibacteria group bacterium]